MYIVGFNGPPESGKDTLAEMLASYMDERGVSLPVRFESLNIPLRHIAYAMVGYPIFPGCYEGEWYARFKTTHFESLDRTGRQLMIDVSESFLKPTYGTEVMAQLLLERQKDFHGVLLIRDLGFQIEVDPLAYHVGVDNFAMVRVERPGKNFDNDSREYVTHIPQRFTRVINDEGLPALRTEAGRIYGRLVNQYGWKL